jgi:mono/diheme cytochrome c family protein
MITLFLALACAPKPADPLANAAVDLNDGPTAQVEKAVTAFHNAHMSAHYTILTSARDAIIRGDLEAARESLTWLADHGSHEGLSDALAAQVAKMNEAAKVAVEAKSINGAAAGVAAIANTCGECHSAVSGGPSFDAPPPPPERTGVNWHMARHQWAADRMWEGMIMPSDTAWKLGVEALREDPLKSEELHSGEMSENEERVAEWLHQMGEFGLSMNDSQARAEFYGGVLGNCSSCHVSEGKGPNNTSE